MTSLKLKANIVSSLDVMMSRSTHPDLFQYNNHPCVISFQTHFVWFPPHFFELFAEIIRQTIDMYKPPRSRKAPHQGWKNRIDVTAGENALGNC